MSPFGNVAENVCVRRLVQAYPPPKEAGHERETSGNRAAPTDGADVPSPSPVGAGLWVAVVLANRPNAADDAVRRRVEIHSEPVVRTLSDVVDFSHEHASVAGDSAGHVA